MRKTMVIYGILIAVTFCWDVFVAQPVLVSTATPYEPALEAAKLLKDWSIWLAGIQTGAIAAIGALIKDGRRARRKGLLPACLAAFCLSLLAAAWLLDTLPQLVIRMESGVSTANDLFAKIVPFYLLRPHVFLPARMGLMITYEHSFFILGIGLFCWMLVDWWNESATPHNPDQPKA
jgi:hypothetical protein